MIIPHLADKDETLPVSVDNESTEKDGTPIMSEENTVCEMNIEPKSETESMVTEMETSRKSSVVNGITSNTPPVMKDAQQQRLTTELAKDEKPTNNLDETNMDELRKLCNETPTYEAWKTGQVPSPLKRGKSCKTPSPPPCPEKVTKSGSLPSNTHHASNVHEQLSGNHNITVELQEV